eukprot:3932954-Rhodomonas_salina.2
MVMTLGSRVTRVEGLGSRGCCKVRLGRAMRRRIAREGGDHVGGRSAPLQRTEARDPVFRRFGANFTPIEDFWYNFRPERGIPEQLSAE